MHPLLHTSWRSRSRNSLTDHCNMALSCGFLRLPTELRLRIYELLFDPRCWHSNQVDLTEYFNEPLFAPCRLLVYNGFVTTTPTVTDGGSQSDFKNFAAVLQTCRTVNEEGVDILYEHTRFTLRVLRSPNLGSDDEDLPYNQIITRGQVRVLGALYRCRFLRRMRHVEVHVSFDLDNYLSRDLRQLEELFRHLKSSRKTTVLRVELWDDGLPGFSEQHWQHVLSRLERIPRRCRVVIQQHLWWKSDRAQDVVEVLSQR